MGTRSAHRIFAPPVLPLNNRANVDSDIDIEMTVDAATHQAATHQPATADSVDRISKGKSLSRRHMILPMLVRGSHPGLNTELEHLLIDRLRSASLVLLAAYSVFLIRRVMFMQEGALPGQGVILLMHLAATVVAGLVAWRLCVRCHIALHHARITEIVLFGTSALFFGVFTYYMHSNAAVDGLRAPTEAAWVMLICVYAIFIPNPWQRAAVVVGMLVTIPLGIQLYLAVSDPVYRDMLANRPASLPGGILESALIMSVAGVAGVFGVYTINRLRRDAFEAKRLGQYHLKQRLGAGGMGEVFLGEHRLLKRPCAIKLIRPENAGDPRALERFEREVQATAKLTHWNTVEIFDYGHSNDGTFYYVMEYLPGQNLNDIVQQHGPLPAARVCYLLAQICDALAEAHHQQLIHRDIKPGNLFVANRGGIYDVIKVLDFGLVKPLLESAAERELTRQGTLTGSPLYLSPEQAMGEETDERSDLYSLGAVAYFALTGKHLFEHSSTMKLILAQVNEQPVMPSQWQADIPPDLEAIVMKCLEKKPEDRFESAQKLRQTLLSCSVADLWSRQDAMHWWESYGCPRKREMDQQVLAALG